MKSESSYRPTRLILAAIAALVVSAAAGAGLTRLACAPLTTRVAPGDQPRSTPRPAFRCFAIESALSGHRLDVSGVDLAPGARVIQHPANDGDNQRWSFEDVGEGLFRIRVAHSGQALSVADDHRSVIQRPVEGAREQLWRVTPLAGGEFKIVNARYGELLDLTEGAMSSGVGLIIWPDNGGQNQRWRIRALS